MRDDTLVLGLLVLLGVNAVDVVTALERLVVGEKDEGASVLDNVLRGATNGREALVDLAEGLVADGVSLLDVGGDVSVGLGEVGEDGSGEGLVGGVGELDRALAELVVLDCVDRVVYDRVVEEMLEDSRAVRLAWDIAVNLTRSHGVGEDDWEGQR